MHKCFIALGCAMLLTACAAREPYEHQRLAEMRKCQSIESEEARSQCLDKSERTDAKRQRTVIDNQPAERAH
jgi:hypothetical protein